jgi:hypothetical protein
MIFGREPATWIGFIEGVLSFLVGAKLLDLSPDQVGAIMAVVTAAFGVYSAAATHDTLLGVEIGLVKSLVALGVAFGLSLSADQTGVAIALATVLLGFFQRTQTSPLEALSLKTGIRPADAPA